MAHAHIMGASGQGKSTLTKQLILSAIADGYGCCYIDPHGSDIDDLLNYIPRPDVDLFDVSDLDKTPTWNPLAAEQHTTFTARAITRSLKDAFGLSGVNTPRIDLSLFNAVATAIEYQLSFADIYGLLMSETLQKENLSTHPIIGHYQQFFLKHAFKDRNLLTESTRSKLHMLFCDPFLADSFSTRPSFSVSESVRNGRVLLIRLPQGQLSIETTKIIGTMLLTQLHLALLANPKPYYPIFVDEASHFQGATMMEMLSGGRKFGIDLTLIHQNLSQLRREVKDSILGNVGERYHFQCSKEDADALDRVTMVTAGTRFLDTLKPFQFRYSAAGKEPIYRDVHPHDYPVIDGAAEKLKAQTFKTWRSRRKQATALVKGVERWK